MAESSTLEIKNVCNVKTTWLYTEERDALGMNLKKYLYKRVINNRE